MVQECELFELFDKQKVVVFIDNKMCTPCVDNVLKKIEILSNKFSLDKDIVILTSGFRKTYLFNDSKFSSMENIYLMKTDIFSVSINLSSPPFDFD
jgi:hypothetical protein